MRYELKSVSSFDIIEMLEWLNLRANCDQMLLGEKALLITSLFQLSWFIPRVAQIQE